MQHTTISQAFGHLTDPRCHRTKRHSLVNILTISLCAIISGCDDFNAIEEYGKSKIDWFKQFLDLPYGIPCHDTFNDVLNRLKPNEFEHAFTQWVMTLGNLDSDIVALDGKVMRGTLDKACGNPAIHLVSAWSVKNGLCFGQVKVSDKSNEITAIPRLLALLDIEGTTITTDAMGCQHTIAKQIVDAKGDYVIAIKGNKGEFYDDVKHFMDVQITQKSHPLMDEYSTIDGDHGRIEQRQLWVTSDVDWLIERHPKWRTVKSLAAVESIREVQGQKSSIERRYFISSHQGVSAEFMGYAIRSHWHVENRLHWQLDVSFQEDKNRLRSGHGAQNISMINKIALNLLKNEKTVKVGIKTKRLKAGWDNDYLLKVLKVGLLTV